MCLILLASFITGLSNLHNGGCDAGVLESVSGISMYILWTVNVIGINKVVLFFWRERCLSSFICRTGHPFLDEEEESLSESQSVIFPIPCFYHSITFIAVCGLRALLIALSHSNSSFSIWALFPFPHGELLSVALN